VTPASFLFHGFMEDLISARLTHTHKDTGTAQEILEDISFEAVVLFTYGRSGQVREEEEEGMTSALETKIRQEEWECLKGRCETCWQRERLMPKTCGYSRSPALRFTHAQSRTTF